MAADSRLAPEHQLPAAYDDCTEAVEWIAKQAAGRAESPEEWLSPSVVDFSRCFLAGESAGANIVYHVGLRIADVDVRPLVVKGLICIHPWFESEELTQFEKSAEGLKFVQLFDSLRSIALPVGSSKDHPFINPAVLPLQPGLKLPPVLVAVAGKDELYERGVMFYEYLKSCGKEVELMEDEGGVHSFHVMLPQYEGTPRFIQWIADYVNNR
ncbi:probable carboxylesterase 17 [Cryptomeria japonica]|uniref:probable carboxylesterase 17 n=1 Tax=Cryptomeria japonica TaxID=3369 RepID=UPI0027DA7774|nr:probable carboxylesterase 17 [Cryptomeria japonica]